VAGDGHAADLESRRDDAVAEGQVVADHLDPEQHLLEVAGHGDLLDWIGQFPFLNPEPDRPSGVIACHKVHAGADHLGDVKAPIHRLDDVGRIVWPRLKARAVAPRGSLIAHLIWHKNRGNFMPKGGFAMRTTMEIDDKLLKRALALTKAKTKKELIHQSLEALIRQQRIERLLGKLGRFPLDLTLRKLTKLRADG